MIFRKQCRFLWFIGIFLLANSCLNSDDCVEETYSSPRSFKMKLVNKDGINLISNDLYNKDSIDLFYNSNLGVTRVQITFQEISDGYLFVSAELPYTILETSNDTYFIYFNHEDTDTLTVMVLQESDGCSTWHRYVDCMYNGNVMDFDPENYAYVGIK